MGLSMMCLTTWAVYLTNKQKHITQTQEGGQDGIGFRPRPGRVLHSSPMSSEAKELWGPLNAVSRPFCLPPQTLTSEETLRL